MPFPQFVAGTARGAAPDFGGQGKGRIPVIPFREERGDTARAAPASWSRLRDALAVETVRAMAVYLRRDHFIHSLLLTHFPKQAPGGVETEGFTSTHKPLKTL
ncbi:hypothetical protein AV530_017503 [Patagioenas fasciata monilis]|uniref:Uncharacterized protein n=1 Tax=Patagioenas fasciata monilis TaxID=372326 RepID=A0A1V4JGT0_PATFA|nr:hypothetical protein AV530_017503 [Patagioenas fasciata monilis]